MDNTEEFESIKIFFPTEKWNSLSDFEKKRFLNIKKNYEYLKSAGIAAKLPRFMSCEYKDTSKLLYLKKTSWKNDLFKKWKMPDFSTDAYNCEEEESDKDDGDLVEKRKMSDLLSDTHCNDDEKITENIVAASLKKAKVMSDSSSQSSKNDFVMSQSKPELSSFEKNSPENLRNMSDSSFGSQSGDEDGNGEKEFDKSSPENLCDMSDSSFGSQSVDEGGNGETEFDNSKKGSMIYETKSSKVDNSKKSSMIYETKSSKVDNSKKSTMIYETKSSKVVSDILNKMKNICNLSHSSFGDYEESDKYHYFASDAEIKTDNKQRGTKTEFQNPINKIRRDEKKLSHLGHRDKSSGSASLQKNMNLHESFTNEILPDFEAGYSNLRSASKKYHMSGAERACNEVIDAFLSMKLPRGTKTIVPVCDITRLR